ncbi:MAG TPA: UDP-N-acetylmuramate--L-alanine ligase [Parasegetibacter sp.]
MIELKDIKKIYFIGIGGIGMSAIARYFHALGVPVSGYDRTRTALTRALEDTGIAIHYEDDVNQAPKDVSLVVYTPAVPREHGELNFYRENNYPVLKRSDVLKIITENAYNICVAGTHGKTTMSTMIAHLLRDSGYGCNAFLGGISANYDTNFWSSSRNLCVVEADEFDRSFLKLSPDVAIITAMDPDHLDIYGSDQDFKEAFTAFSSRVKEGGLLLYKYGLDLEKSATRERYSYSLTNTNADIHAQNVQVVNGGYEFDVVIKLKAGKTINGCRLEMGGLHNVENAVAAIAVAQYVGINEDAIRKGIASFKGVKRRFEYHVKSESQVYIDDYAHHPEELKALLGGVKNLFCDMRSTILFQPHLYSRTRDFAEGFAESLQMADEVILLPVYAAREKPIPQITSEWLAEKMAMPVRVIEKEKVLDWLREDFLKREDQVGRVLITAGAGDIDNLVEPIKNILSGNSDNSVPV